MDQVHPSHIRAVAVPYFWWGFSNEESHKVGGGGVPKTSAMVASRADPIDRLSSSEISPAGMSSPEELLPSMAPKGRCRDALGAK